MASWPRGGGGRSDPEWRYQRVLCAKRGGEGWDGINPNALHHTFSTIAQCATALAALIGFLGLWRLDRLREQIERLETHPKDDPTYARLTRLQGEEWGLLGILRSFLIVTLIILGAAVVAFLYVDQAKGWAWTPWLLWIAGGSLVVGPILVVWVAARLARATIALAG